MPAPEPRASALKDRKVVIVGAGPAGLTAAWALMKAGVRASILEAEAQVGGHARTAEHGGFLFDVGGHRFFTKIAEVQHIWDEVMGEGFLRVQRLSRILYRGRLYHYPLKPFEAFRQMGPLESAWVILSYLRKMLFPLAEEKTLEQWMINRFGPRLFLMFFRTYTEKVWGMPCSEIGAEWAAQRIKGLTLWGAVRNAFYKGGPRLRSLAGAFDYPERGPGMLWSRMARIVTEAGQELGLERPVVRVRHEGFRVSSVTVRHAGQEERHPGTDFLASMPLPELVQALDPPAPPEVLADARTLRYRDFITVALMLHRDRVFPDNWLYIHTPDVLVARIQNYKNWSAAMVPRPDETCLGLEYFCTEGDELWSLPDQGLVELAKREIQAIGLARSEDVFDAAVLRQKKAYPVYDSRYREPLARLRDYLSRFENLQMIGRNGLHKYNNQDHAMLTALLAVRNVLADRREHDVWAVNTENEYHEAEADPSAE